MSSDFRLNVFLSVVANGSFSKAAKDMFITQPAVSKHIKELETIYETRLFDRNGNKIELTKAGKTLQFFAEKLLDDYNKLNYEMHLLNSKKIGKIKIGASSTIAQYVLPDIIARFTNVFPDIQIIVKSGNTRQMESDLRNKRIDIALLEGLSRQPDFKYRFFMYDKLIFIASKNSDIFKQSSVEISDLISYPFIVREQGSGTLECFENVLKENRLGLTNIEVKCVLDNTEGILRYVNKTDTVSVVSILALKKCSMLNIREVEVKNIEINRDLVIAGHHGEETPLVQEFIRFVLENCRDK